MAERVKLWREDYPHFAEDPVAMVQKLLPLKPLVGKETLDRWNELATTGEVDALFESVMRRHYDPCYARSTRHHYGPPVETRTVELESLDPSALAGAARRMAADFSE